MYQMFALVIGMILAVMVSVNGELALVYGLFPSAVIIHVVGVLAALLLCAVRKEPEPIRGRAPLWIYLGGVVGVLTVIFNNFAFAYISITSIVALGLLGQMAVSLAIDAFGWFGMEKHPFRKSTLVGFAFSLVGVFVMLDYTVMNAVLAVILSFASGMSVVISRCINARLAGKIGPLRGALVNHLAGLPVSVIAALAAVKLFPSAGALVVSPRPWIYVGGAMGVVVVLLCNMTVPKVPAFRLTVLTFTAQIFTGILLDVAAGTGYSAASFAGGIIIALGVAVNLITEQVIAVRERKRSRCLEELKKTEDAYQRRLIEKHFRMKVQA